MITDFVSTKVSTIMLSNINPKDELARRAKAKVLYNGNNISDYIMDFSYTDDTDKTDDISIKLSDREKLWYKGWFPQTSDMMTAQIELINWDKIGDNKALDLGNFEVDSVDFSQTMSVKGIAAYISSNIRSEKKNKSWEKISLSSIASDIAKNAKLELVYETNINPFYDKSDQNDKSDLSFLEELCKSDGLCVKVTDSQLIIFDESKYDTLPSVATIERGNTYIYGYPTFKRNAKNIYTACEISYFDSKTDKTYKGSFTAPNAPNTGHVLRLRENFNSEKDDIDLNRKAKARLREQNKKEWTVDITLKGDIIYFAGINIDIKGFWNFDGKYNITNCTHSIGSSGYTVKINARKCLEGY